MVRLRRPHLWSDRRPAQHQLGDPQRSAHSMGSSRPLQAWTVVVALGELDAWAFARASRNPDAGHFSGAVLLGGAAACHCGWAIGAAGHHRLRFDLSVSAQVAAQLAHFLFAIGFQFASNIIRATNSSPRNWESDRAVTGLD